VVRPEIDDGGARARKAREPDVTRARRLDPRLAHTRPQRRIGRISAQGMARMARVGATAAARAARPLTRRGQPALPLLADLLRTRAALFTRRPGAAVRGSASAETNEQARHPAFGIGVGRSTHEKVGVDGGIGRFGPVSGNAVYHPEFQVCGVRLANLGRGSPSYRGWTPPGLVPDATANDRYTPEADPRKAAKM
jgi:hypothetical protein